MLTVHPPPPPPPDCIARARAWLQAFDAAHPEVSLAPQREGYRRGLDVYRPGDLLNSLGIALDRFCRSSGRYPDPVALPETRDHFFAMKFFEFIPLPGPADKLGHAHYLPAEIADEVFRPARPWVSTRPELPADDAVVPGAYLLKLALGWEQNIRLHWPPSPQERTRIEDSLRTWFRSRYGVIWGEWWYGLGEQRVYLEEDLSVRMAGLPEIKIYVRDGKPVLGYQRVHHFDIHVKRQHYFDFDLKPLAGRTRGYHPLNAPLPTCIAQMMKIAAGVGQRFRLVRVDFVDVGGPRPCLGELTLCDMNAGRHYDPPEFDRVVKRLLFD